MTVSSTRAPRADAARQEQQTEPREAPAQDAGDSAKSLLGNIKSLLKR
jgi:hypothetical protein